MNPRHILSRHRLRQPYRSLLVGLFLLPVPVLLLGLLIGNGMTPALFDPRLLLPLLVMLIPAVYVWREGIDTHPDGLTARIHWPRYYAYAELRGWRLEDHPEGIILTIWDRQRQVLAVHAAHLTRLPMLLSALEKNVSPPMVI